MSGPRPARPMPLLLVSLLMVAATGPLQAAAPSPTEALLLAAQTGTSPSTSQPGSAPGTTQFGTPIQPAPLPLPVIPPAPNQTPVRLGLGRSLSTTQTQAAEGLYILVDNRLVATTGPGATVTLTLVGTGQIQLGGQVDPVPTGGAQPQPSPSPVPAPMAPVGGTIRLVPKPAAPPRANWVTYAGRTYRGEGELKYSPLGKLTFVNTVNLEEYLFGVVPKEMEGGWPGEALKAQAVAARTFALRRIGGYPLEGFDLTDTTSDQAYGGVKSEYPDTNAAVRATTGEVVTYDGKMIPTYYHASSGGHTESVETVWSGSPQPYLVGVPDFDNLPDNPFYQWSVPFSLETLTSLFLAKGVDVGGIKSIIPAGTVGYLGGRPSSWKVIGTKGEKTVRGEDVRFALGLRSAPRGVQYLTASGAPTTGGTVASSSPAAGALAGVGTSAPAPALQSVKVLGANGKLVDRPLKGAVVQGADAKSATLDGAATAQAADGRQLAFQPPAPPPPTPTPTPTPGTVATIRFDGGGWGHGIGMSQYGAYGMALQGKTYREILTHYYTGTKVEKP